MCARAARDLPVGASCVMMVFMLLGRCTHAYYMHMQRCVAHAHMTSCAHASHTSTQLSTCATMYQTLTCRSLILRVHGALAYVCFSMVISHVCTHDAMQAPMTAHRTDNCRAAATASALQSAVYHKCDSMLQINACITRF